LAVPVLAGCGNKANNNQSADMKLKNTEPQFENVRQPAVAGQFYPGEQEKLKSQVKGFLDQVREEAEQARQATATLRALMVPHAGYPFSGPVAAHGYSLLKNKPAGTVVLLGNAHSAPFSGIALDRNDAWKTPLGTVPVATELADRLVSTSSLINYNRQAHAQEHSLEVQLPFLQTVLENDFRILPILFGADSSLDQEAGSQLASLLEQLLPKDSLVIASSDMSHYPAYADANQIDRATLEVIEKGDSQALYDHLREVESRGIPEEHTALCGEDAVRSTMQLHELAGGGKIKALHYANSGDTAVGDKSGVVGYGTVAFWASSTSATHNTGEEEQSEKPSDELTEEQKQLLLQIAKQTVEAYVTNGQKPEFDITDRRLHWKEGAFVTLKQNGRLRGCIGQIVPTDKPLWQVVRDQAVEAASEDPRFPPVEPSELDGLSYEVSVLSQPVRIDDWRKVEPGKHGVIVRQGFKSGVYLPQVASEAGWGREQFLSHLCANKAGLSPDCYKSEAVEIRIFTAQVIPEQS